MSGAQHTPGPWSLTIDPYEDVDPPSEPFCTITAGNGGYMGESGFELSGICCEADARLIAAAPQLYEAAVKHLEWIEKEHAGPDYAGLTRDTHPDGESIWRKWWNEQLDLCADTERLCLTATAKARGETA